MRVRNVTAQRQAWKRKRASIVDQMRFMNITDHKEHGMEEEEQQLHINQADHDKQDDFQPAQNRVFYKVITPAALQPPPLHPLMKIVQKKAQENVPEYSRADQEYFTKPTTADHFIYKYGN